MVAAACALSPAAHHSAVELGIWQLLQETISSKAAVKTAWLLISGKQQSPHDLSMHTSQTLGGPGANEVRAREKEGERKREGERGGTW